MTSSLVTRASHLLALAARGSLLATLVAAPAASQAPARHVILVTIDGLRHQELFGGADSAIMATPKAGVSDTAGFRAAWWRATAEERRRAVMPFFWDSLVPRGVLLGASADAPFRSTNGLKFSAPGYQEIYTGQPQRDVTSNDDTRYPHTTIFDVVHAASKRRTDVAAFVSWDVQGRLVSADSTTTIVSAALEPLPREAMGGSGALIQQLQRQVGYPEGGIRYDAFTAALAQEYLLRYQPSLLHIGFGETDEEAHWRHYDKLFTVMHATDEMLRDLWRAIRINPALRDNTTILITADHGRGGTPKNWTDHGKDVDGADRIWFFAVGAGVPARGVVAGVAGTQSQVGPTVLKLLGLDPKRLGPAAGAPIDFATLRR